MNLCVNHDFFLLFLYIKLCDELTCPSRLFLDSDSFLDSVKRLLAVKNCDNVIFGVIDIFSLLNIFYSIKMIIDYVPTLDVVGGSTL